LTAQKNRARGRGKKDDEDINMDEIGNDIIGLLAEMKGEEATKALQTPPKMKIKSIDEEEK